MEYKVEELIESISKTHTFPNNEIIFLNTSDIEKGYVLHRNYSETKSLPGQAKKSIQKGDILYSEIRPKNERYAYIDFECENYVVSTKLMVLRNKKPKTLNTRFFYLYITSRTITNTLQNLAESRSGTFPQITFSEVKKLQIKLPNLTVQNKIVKTIESINQKIVTNQKIIANLEELSQTLFKRWFVDFEFPDENGNPYKSSDGEMIDSELGNIPRDWEVNELGNYVDIIKGLSYKGAFLDKQHERSDSFPLLSISNFNFISGFKSNKTKYYFGDYKERHLVNPGDILIAATDLTQDRKILGAPAIIPNLNKTMIFSLDVFKITETTIPKYVLYFLLQSAKYREFVEGSATGTTVIRIAKNVILKVPIVIDKDISLKFDDLIKPYMEKIEHLSQENQKLTQLRDTLLPKLMSGEIEIPDHIEVNEDELSI